MKPDRKELISVLELIMITVWSSLQYVMLRNVPDDMPQFAFLFITGLLGFVLLSLIRAPKYRMIRKKTWLKGGLFALELLGFNFFLLIGSRNISPVVSSSLVSMYFIFVTPLLLLFRRKVSFRSVVAGLTAIVALLLLFDADVDALVKSPSMLELGIAAFFFATYIVSVSIFGDNEDSTALALSQLLFSVIFTGIGWLAEARITGVALTIPTDRKFWISALFIGILIRALYSVIQISAQKNVQPIKASLIFAGEIIFTLLLNPIVSKIIGVEYTTITVIQIIGSVLFLIAMLLTDDAFMSKFGYMDMQDVIYINSRGETVRGRSISRKTVNLTMIISLVALTVTIVICLGAIGNIKSTTIANSISLGQDAATDSGYALAGELEESAKSTVDFKANYAESVLWEYADTVSELAGYATSLYTHPEYRTSREAMYPLAENGGIWAMQRTLADGLNYETVREENGLLGNMEDVFAPVVKALDKITTVYIGTENGLLISYDKNSAVSAVGGECYYEFRGRPWYADTKDAGGVLFTEAYEDDFGRGLCVTCSYPVRDGNGTVRGVIGMDVLVSDLNSDLVSAGIDESESAYLLTGDGKVIASTHMETELGENHPVTVAMDSILTDASGIQSVGQNENATYVAYSTIDFTGWHLVLTSPVSKVIEPAYRIYDRINNNTLEVVDVVNNGIHSIVESCLILFAMIILTITFIVGKFSLRISKPLQQLEKDVRDMSSGNLGYRTGVETDDEIGSLATTFNAMASSLQNYIVELKDVTAKEERIASELSLARHIQASMLPSEFPAFPERDEFDLFASMDPAKEVGGDFYDFFLIDESHLGLVIADVSGKGIPAALFMSVSKALIKARTMQGGTPGEILAHVNNQLLESNEAEMFVTVWLGILDLKTGKLIATNAGHEYPVIGHSDGRFELLKDKHGLVVAAMQGVRYRDYEIQLEPGDRLLVYTDGVAEATASDMTLFGTDRLLSAVNARPFTDCKTLVGDVTDAINGFVLDAPQFDDITMLCVEYKKRME